MAKRIWILVIIVSIVYVSTLALFSIDPSFVSGRGYPVNFESNDIDLTAVSYQTINPSFELGDDGEFIGWEAVVWAGHTAFYKTSNASRTGAYSALLFSTSTTSSALVTNSSSKYSVVPGETYLAAVWVNVANVSEGYGALISIAWFDSNDAYLSTSASSSLSNASSWTKIFVSDVAPEGAASAKLELHLDGICSVWYDDISFSKVISEYSGLTWASSRQGLESARIEANEYSLTLEGTFAYSSDEKLKYEMSSALDTSEYSFITFEYKTSAKNGSGLLLVLNYINGTKVTTYGTAVTNEWTVVYIDTRKTPAYLYYLGESRQTVPGKQLSSIEILLDDVPDTVSSGTYMLQIRNIVFHKFATLDLLLLVESIILLSSLIILAIHNLDPMRGQVRYVFLLLFGATMSFVAVVTQIIFPVPLYVGSTSLDLSLALQLIGALLVLSIVIAKKTFLNPIAQDIKAKVSNVIIIGWILGLILIPSLGFVIRANNAVTLPLFDDELSYGLTAWGLSQGSLVGLNLAAFAPEAQDLIDTGYFEVQSWPITLQVPFTSTSLYPDFTLVGPNFSHPFLGTLIAAPFIHLFGFNAFTIRLPFILFSVGTAILIFVIAARKGHILAGLMGSSFFSFVPYITHYGAGAYLDNILAFFFMLTVYFVLEYSETNEILKRNRYAYLAAIFAAVCALIKIQGAVVSLFVLIALYLSGCEKKLLTRSALLYVSIVLIFPITGLLISSEAFVLSLQCMLSISSSYNSVQIPSELSGIFSFFDLIRYWSVAITLLCIVYLLADNTREKKFLVLGAVSWILYGLLFSYKEWYLLSFFAIAAVIFGYVFSNVVTCQKRLSTIVLISFLSIPNLEKAGASLLQTIGFTTPLVLTTFLAIYLDRRGSNWSKQMRKLLYCLDIFYILVSFILMIITTWNYKYWA